ncbi:resuscitation-promoting factor [Cellulomonas marina]|uniref:resuscitation-promoting factor n=1 Tax=Cellulomonas marina TaxID=988821 RepID=UPI0023B29D58|nr:resuscitation-promoting factor [Cellulomonas marina]
MPFPALRRTARPAPTDAALPTSASTEASTEPSTEPSAAPARPRRLLPVAAAVTALVLTGGAAGYAQAHKTVTLDVDGQEVRVSTFAGSVDALLEDRGVATGARDTVTPTGGLQDGTTVVVRHARPVLVEQDGATRTVWTTALTADAALEAMAARGEAGALVASRSSAGRIEVGMALTEGTPVDVVADGATRPAPEGATTAAAALAGLGLEVGPLDRVRVRTTDAGRVEVVLVRVVEQDVTTTSEVPFASSTVEDPDRLEGTRAVVTAGVPGVRTLVEHVTTVDGVETARSTVQDSVTQAPVDEVVAVGTKPKPKPAPKPAPAAATGGGSAPAASSGSTGSLNWAALAACESGGNPSIVSASGKYHGLYQFSVATWQAVGGSGLPSQASAAEQTARAQALYERSGAGQWPHCGPRLFS